MSPSTEGDFLNIKIMPCVRAFPYKLCPGLYDKGVFHKNTAGSFLSYLQKIPSPLCGANLLRRSEHHAHGQVVRLDPSRLHLPVQLRFQWDIKQSQHWNQQSRFVRWPNDDLSYRKITALRQRARFVRWPITINEQSHRSQPISKRGTSKARWPINVHVSSAQNTLQYERCRTLLCTARYIELMGHKKPACFGGQSRTRSHS